MFHYTPYTSRAGERVGRKINDFVLFFAQLTSRAERSVPIECTRNLENPLPCPPPCPSRSSRILVLVHLLKSKKVGLFARALKYFLGLKFLIVWISSSDKFAWVVRLVNFFYARKKSLHCWCTGNSFSEVIYFLHIVSPCGHRWTKIKTPIDCWWIYNDNIKTAQCIWTHTIPYSYKALVWWSIDTFDCFERHYCSHLAKKSCKVVLWF